MNAADYILFSGGAGGTEAEFGANAERFGIEEVNFSFEGHNHVRTRGLRILNHEELAGGDVSLAYVSKLMHRRYSEGSAFRKVLQTIWYQINQGQEIFVVGEILDDNTVTGGTGWGAEFAKLCNKPLHVYDQTRQTWHKWMGTEWAKVAEDEVRVGHIHFTGTGSRNITDAGAKAIRELFDRSFK